MANFMARYRRGDGHYADVDCVNAELERYLVLSCNELETRRPPKLVALVCPVLKEHNGNPSGLEIHPPGWVRRH